MDKRFKTFIVAMAKHLPPSASNLRVLDVNGEVGPALAELRADLEIITVPGQAANWPEPTDSADAIMAYAYHLNDAFLTAALTVLRPGGRLIVLDPKSNQVQEAVGQTLEDAGYARILVENMIADDGGVLMRGEKPHTAANTLDRVQQVAGQDANGLVLGEYRGRYVHLLVKQKPNIAVWARTPGDTITWKAATVQRDKVRHLLAFTSLPRAVGFMQPAVLNGKIKDINKVGKFKKSVAENWSLPVLLNPDASVLEDATLAFIEVDPLTAEAADE